MRITIGELVNELMKYSSKIESMIVGSTPVMYANLTKDHVTRVYLYIAQVGENKYTACSDIFDTLGSRFVPTGMIEDPWVRDIDNSHVRFGGSLSVTDTYTHRIVKGTYGELISFIHMLLKAYEVLDVNKTIYSTKVNALGFTSSRIVKAIDKGFNDHSKKSGTVNDLFSIVVKDRKTFTLDGLKTKEVQCVVDKLSDRGVYVRTSKTSINDITYKRRA